VVSGIFEMSRITTFEDLEVWKKSHRLVLDIYKLTKEFPTEELFGITRQIRRAAVSIPNNIAEGFGRHTTKDLIHFLIQARGSLCEIRYLILLSTDLKIVSKEDKSSYINDINEIGRMLNGLIRSLRKRLTSPTTNH
jgi:four helix bundle protein